MALLGNVNEDYTKSGKGFLGSLADKLSYVPIFGGALAWPIGMLGTIIESAKWLFQGKITSAITVLAAGTADNSVNAVTGGTALMWWGGNALSGMTTGSNLGTHARAATETVVGGIFGMLGHKPEVLQSYPAAIGSINTSVNMGGRDNFRDQIAAERGMTRAQMDARADRAYVNQTQGTNALGA